MYEIKIQTNHPDKWRLIDTDNGTVYKMVPKEGSVTRAKWQRTTEKLHTQNVMDGAEERVDYWMNKYNGAMQQLAQAQKELQALKGLDNAQPQEEASPGDGVVRDA